MNAELIKLRSICSKNGLILSEIDVERLAQYVALLTEWNSKINLVSRKDISEIWFKHILHSISLLFFVELQPGMRVLDLGTGGGLPGLPLAIVNPDIRFVLLDSIKKKITAVQDMIGSLALTNASTLNSRAEDLGTKKTRDFHVVVTRAVAPLKDLIAWSRPLVGPCIPSIKDSEQSQNKIKVNGPSLIALKGGDLAEEISAAHTVARPENITIIDLVFDGSEEFNLEEKKIVVIQPL